MVYARIQAAYCLKVTPKKENDLHHEGVIFEEKSHAVISLKFPFNIRRKK